MQTKINKVVVFLIIANVTLLGVLAFMLIQEKKNEKYGFIVNQRVFNEFQGKKELEERLALVKQNNQSALDSLKTLITLTANFSLIKTYQDQIDEIESNQLELTNRYTEDIWKRLNEYIIDYGKKNNFSFIFGASGNGNLMYAGEAMNVTDEVIRFVNEKYVKAE